MFMYVRRKRTSCESVLALYLRVIKILPFIVRMNRSNNQRDSCVSRVHERAMSAVCKLITHACTCPRNTLPNEAVNIT